MGALRENQMHFIVWLILAGVAGFIASKLINKSGSGLLMDIILGIVGGWVGNFIVFDVLHLVLPGGGMTGWLVEGLIAVGGAALVIFLWNMIFRRA